MKTNTLFKILIDGLFVSQLVGVIGVAYILPFGILKINQNNAPVETWEAIHWTIIILSFISYVFFVIALYHLRKIAKHLLFDNYFTIPIINSLKKSGYMFICSGFTTFVVVVIEFINNLSNNKFELIYDTDFMICLFMTSIGLFFLIQSKALLSARELKHENDLTI